MEVLLKALVESLGVVSDLDPNVKNTLQLRMSPNFGLLDVLQSNGKLTEQEVGSIKSMNNIKDRNERLLEIILQKGSIQALANALLETAQSHIVAYLASGGVYNPDFGNTWPLTDVQLYLLDATRRVWAQCLETTGLTYELFRHEVFGAQERDFILNRETEHARNEALLEILRRSSQKNYVETINVLSAIGQGYIASILKHGALKDDGEPIQTDQTDLPVDVYRLCIVKAYLRALVISPERHPEKDIFTALCSVSRKWNGMVFCREFRKLLSYHSSGYFNRILRRATVVCNNRFYLSWHVTPKKFIDKLHHAECLTDDDTRFIKCQTYDHDKIDETISVVRDLSIEKYAVYVNCLRLTEQHLSADISEIGGVTVKAKSINDEMANLEQMEHTVIERLNKVRDKKVSRSPELQGEIDFLGRHGIEILDAFHDRGIVTWFLVHSEEALEQIHRWRDNDEMEVLLTKLFGVVGTWGEPIAGQIKSDWAIVDGAQFNREVIVLPMTLYMLCELKIIPDKGQVKGITSLQDNIYVLHQKSILIYDGQSPFSNTGEICASEFGSLSDISSCQKLSCLYVVDEGNTCVWKVKLADQKVEKWLSDVSMPFTISVSSSGDVLMLRDGHPAFLEVYGGNASGNASLSQKLQLPETLVSPRHAVETRSGNYDVLFEQALIEITKKGMVTRTHKSFLELEPLKNANHLAVDIAERIYVSEGNRIVQFDSQLVFNQVILDRWNKRSPTRMCHVKEKKQLLVVHSSGKGADVYNLKPRI